MSKHTNPPPQSVSEGPGSSHTLSGTPRFDTADGTPRLGDYFLHNGQLSPADVARIIERQAQTGKLFGQAAIELGLLTHDAVQQALASQFLYPTAQSHPELAPFPIASMPHSATAEVIRRLRTQVLSQVKEIAHPSLLIVSPDTASSSLYVAISLALSFAQNRQRTLLINADLRHTASAALIQAPHRPGLSAILAGRAPAMHCLQASPLPALSLLPAGSSPPNPSELLTAPAIRTLMQQLAHHHDIVLLHAPPAIEFPDAQLLAGQLHGSLIIARQHQTRLRDVRLTHRLLQQAGGRVLGSVLDNSGRQDRHMAD